MGGRAVPLVSSAPCVAVAPCPNLAPPSLPACRARSLPYFTTHQELVRLQREALDAKRKARVGLAKDDDW